MDPLTSFFSSSLISFALVGFTSTVLDFAVLNGLRKLDAKVYIATGCGFLVGTLNGYIFNSLLVFQQTYTAVRYEKYFLVSLGGLMLTEAIMYWLHTKSKRLTLNQAKLAAVCIVFFWNYGLSKYWAFR